MKKIIIFIFLMTTSFHYLLIAQSREENNQNPKTREVIDANKKGEFILSTGLGIPLGQFGNQDIEDPESGISNVGLLVNGEYRGFITKSIYLGMMGRFQFNRIDKDVFQEFFRNQLPSSVSITIKTTPWYNTSIMGGFGTETFVGDETKLFTRFMLGTTFSTSPFIETTLTDGTTSIREKQSKSSTNEFSYSIGVGVKVNLKPGSILILSADFFATEPIYNDVRFERFSNGSRNIDDTFSFSQEMQLMNIAIGLVL